MPAADAVQPWRPRGGSVSRLVDRDSGVVLEAALSQNNVALVNRERGPQRAAA
jgi:hypothetical protein